MKKQNSSVNRLTLTGIVTPYDWDDDSNLTAIAISTETEEDYRVTNAKAMRKLMKHLHEMVDVKGVAGEAEDGELTLHVEDFELVESPLLLADDEDAEEDDDFDEDDEYDDEDGDYEYDEEEEEYDEDEAEDDDDW